MANENTRVITPEAILSYPHVFTPQAPPARKGEQEGEPKYSAAFVFTKEAQATKAYAALRAAANSVLKAVWGGGIRVGKKKFTLKQALDAGHLNTPFRTDWAEKGYPEGSIYINARSKAKPGIVSSIPDPNKINPKTGKPMPMTIEDEDAVYPGVIVRASVTAFTYDTAGNRGVSFALNNIQVIRDGDRLDSRVAAESEFESDETLTPQLEDETGTDAQDAAAEEVPDELADLF
jgi:hypothetical protein